MEIITKSPTETESLGQKIGATLKGGEVIALTGQLGAGKTAFTKGLAKALGVTTQILSPTFILMRKYEAGAHALYHVDLYRFEKNVDSEVEQLGIFDLWERPENIFIIEWADRLASLPAKAIKIKIEESGENDRIFTIENLP